MWEDKKFVTYRSISYSQWKFHIPVCLARGPVRKTHRPLISFDLATFREQVFRYVVVD